MRKFLREAHASHPEDLDIVPIAQDAQCSLGVRAPWIILTVDGNALRLTADQADQLAADLRIFAIELRNGGQVT